jgi:hypothetical protein
MCFGHETPSGTRETADQKDTSSALDWGHRENARQKKIRLFELGTGKNDEPKSQMLEHRLNVETARQPESRMHEHRLDVETAQQLKSQMLEHGMSFGTAQQAESQMPVHRPRESPRQNFARRKSHGDEFFDGDKDLSLLPVLPLPFLMSPFLPSSSSINDLRHASQKATKKKHVRFADHFSTSNRVRGGHCPRTRADFPASKNESLESHERNDDQRETSPAPDWGTVKTLANKKRVSFNAMMNEQRLLPQTGVTVRTPANKKRTRFKKLRELTTVTDLIR